MARRTAADETASGRDGKNTELLKEIRERYAYASDMWRETREERAIDMRYIAGDPWDEEDRRERKDAGRPCINHDELGQYVNACVNSARQNKKGIKIEPAGRGATPKTAETRQGIVRRIEYRSMAPSIYVTQFQAMVEGSYGFFRISRRYVSDDSFDQEIVIKNIANPDSVLYDPDTKEPDWSDGKWCFVLDPIPRKEFKRRWPKARVVDFSPDDLRVAKDWLNDKTVLTAEYWKIVETPYTLYQLADGTAVRELPKGVEAVQTREVLEKKLVQYMTNGIEILEENPQPGELLAIIPVVGLERYIDEDGSGAKRKLFSLVRLARDPQMSLAYLNSQEMEEAGLTPKTPYVGYVGQFESDSEAWETATKQPHAFLQADPITDATSGTVLPLPRREPFTPNFAQYETAKESCRRAVQAAMGISPLPTSAQRQNEKSGVALERIQAQQQIGSFHFTDNYERALAFAGRVIDSWIPVVYDTEREIALGKPDDSHEVVRINTAEPYADEKTGELKHFPVTDKGDHDVTISDGPSYASQQEAASDFLDLLVQNLEKIPPPGSPQAKLFALAIRMKQLGPMGDEMADIVSPDETQPLPPQAQAKLQQQSLMISKLSDIVHKLMDEKQAKLPELAMKERVALIQARAGIIEAFVKAQSSEALALFQADLEHIDRQLALIPDPGAETVAGGAPAPAGLPGPQPAGAPGLQIVPQPGGAPPQPQPGT
jgi:hypothetical protein